MLTVYDKFGHEQTLAWLYEQFGNVEIEAPPNPAEPFYEIVELRENDDVGPGDASVTAPACIITRLLDQNGAPLPGVTCVFWWPDAPPLPGSGWHNQGVPGTTGTAGTVDFAMGSGAYYDPRHAQGPHHLWVRGEGSSEIIRGLGMIAGTNHRHLDVTWKRTAADPDPEPIEPPGDAVLAICQAKVHIDAAEVALAGALAALGGICPD